ncbi:MAG: hypothetical protein WBD47_02200 [Phormidesmis sp.]
MSGNPKKRKRGVVLTQAGLQKLLTAKRKAEIWENDGDRYTFEALSQRSGLAPITVAKVLNRETGVDKQSLVLCLDAFDLILTKEDYAKPNHQASLSDTAEANSSLSVPRGWRKAGSRPNAYDILLDSAVAFSGQHSALIQSKLAQADGFGTMMQAFKAGDYRGKRLKLSAYLRTERVEFWAGLWMRVDGANDQSLSFDNMQNRAITGTTDWTQYVVVLDVPAAAELIAFGVLLAGAGRVWCDRFHFETVSSDTSVTSQSIRQNIPDKPINLDFDAV